MDDIPPRERSRRSDPITSHLAAEELKSADRHYMAILEALKSADGTIYELAARTGLSHVQCARRLPELERMELAWPTDKLKLGGTGRLCRVWRRAKR